MGFEEFFELHSRRLVGLVAVSTGNVALAEDVTQEACIRAFQRWERVAHLDRPDLWVLRVALNLATDARRVKANQSVPLTDDLRQREQEIDGLWIKWGLTQLSPMQRAAFVLHHLQGREVTEVARMLHRSPETIKTHLSLARNKLRRVLAPADA
jgi:RNA polymerase sigma-70 factor (ECF subfamily)